MKKNNLRLLLLALPMLTLLFTTSCSEDPADSKDDAVEEEKPLEPLVDREPEVKEYFKVMNNVIEEYLDAGETLISTMENLESGKLGLLESAAAVQDLMESWESIEELEGSLEKQGTVKENIEAKLNAKDMLEFKDMYSESITRMDELAKRIEDLDLTKYLE
jgi:hypothetical protein